MNTSINKTGVINSDYFLDFVQNPYDRNLYTEPDGSVLIRVAHHNNPAGGVFVGTYDYADKVYIDANRWFIVSLADQIKSGKWELMVKQKTTSDATETKYRWIQNTSPMAGSLDSVKAANITKITSSGYSTVDVAGGIYHAEINSYLVIANANNGNWYGAFGAWSQYSGGIPGYPNTTVTSGYMDLYFRVDPMIAKFGNNYIKCNNIIEI